MSSVINTYILIDIPFITQFFPSEILSNIKNIKKYKNTIQFSLISHFCTFHELKYINGFFLNGKLKKFPKIISRT